MRNEYRILPALSIVAMACGEDGGSGGAARGADFGERPRLESDAETEPTWCHRLNGRGSRGGCGGTRARFGFRHCCVPDEALGCDSPTSLRICGPDGSSTVVVQCPDGEGVWLANVDRRIVRRVP